jgi:hypothetical protein
MRGFPEGVPKRGSHGGVTWRDPLGCDPWLASPAVCPLDLVLFRVSTGGCRIDGLASGDFSGGGPLQGSPVLSPAGGPLFGVP